MNHECEYILTAYYIHLSNIERCGDLYIFKLTKKNIKNLITKYGGYAHGTKHKLGKITEDGLDKISNDKEYTLRPKYGDSCWKELLQYSVQEI